MSSSIRRQRDAVAMLVALLDDDFETAEQILDQHDPREMALELAGFVLSGVRQTRRPSLADREFVADWLGRLGLALLEAEDAFRDGDGGAA
jgi:hypothetical protein